MSRDSMNKFTDASIVFRSVVLSSAVILLSACGGGGGGGSAPALGVDPPPTPPPSTFMPGVFQSDSNFEDMCAVPRTGLDFDQQPFPDTLGTLVDEKNWIRSWNNNLYLWFDEIPDLDPAITSNSVAQYFALNKTNDITPSGAPKDQFHFTANTAEFNSQVQSGVEAGYGISFAFISSSPPRKLLVAYTQPDSPATNVNLARGAEILTVDGVDLANGSDVDALNAGLFPSELNESHTFTVLDVGSSTPRTITMQSLSITIETVQNLNIVDTPTGKVGYFLFTDHIATAEDALANAIETLLAGQVTDLVLDLRYNGGGLLAIASELSYMIAGETNIAGQPFETLQFNSKHQVFNPVTGDRLGPFSFQSTTLGFGATTGDPLPSLNLSRVFVLTSSGTCSASESIMNSLQGIDVEVIQIGTTTCGKPYGFFPADNCGTTYFSIQFRGINANNFGDYPDGFTPANTTTTQGVEIAGCVVSDDFSRALGDPNENQFAAALAYRVDSTCPAINAPSATALTGFRLDATNGKVVKPLWRQSRVITGF